jgi:hypothetical protein
MNDELSMFVEQQNAEPVPAEGTTKKKRGRKKAEGGEEKPKKEPKPRRDNLEYVKNLESIAGVRKFMQIAIAKKAKSVGNQEAINRYDGEIEAAKAKLAELLAMAEQAENPIAKLIELDEEPNKIITHFIKYKEGEVAKYEEGSAKMPKSILKNIPADIPVEFFDELGIDLVEPLKKRHEKNDFRLQAVCRAFNFMKAVEAGDILLVEGKFRTKAAIEEAAAKAAEATAEPAEEA